MCPSQEVLGVRVCANLMILRVHKYSQSKRFLQWRYASSIRVVPWAVPCPPLTLSPRQELDSILFNYHLSQLRDRCDIAEVASLFRSGNGAAHNAQLPHITQSLAASVSSWLWSRFWPGLGHSRYTVLHLYPVALCDCLLRTTTAHPLWSSHWHVRRTGESLSSEVKQTRIPALPFSRHRFWPVQTSQSLFHSTQPNNSTCLSS